MIKIRHTRGIVEGELSKREVPVLLDCAELLFLCPGHGGDFAGVDDLFAVPFPIGAGIDQYLLIPINQTVHCK